MLGCKIACVAIGIFGFISGTGASALRGPKQDERNYRADELTACAPFLTDFGNATFQDDGTMMGRSGGEWSPCTHLKIYGLNFAPFFGRFLSYQLQPKTALEFGCGLGTTSDYIARHTGASVTCIEPEKTLGSLIGSLRRDNVGKGQLHQLALNIFDEETEKRACTSSIPQSDLVLSLEVAEHIPVQFHPQMIEFLAKSTRKWLVFSAARPNQGGTGHLNESMFTPDEWVAKWEEAGLVHMPKLTKMARRAAYPMRSWDLFANTNVFKNPAHPAEDTDEPHEMLADFMFGGFDFRRFEYEVGDLDHQHKAALGFAAGSNAAMWPTLTLWEQKVKKGLMCNTRPHVDKATGAQLADVRSHEDGEAAHVAAAAEPVESAWAWKFYAESESSDD